MSSNNTTSFESILAKANKREQLVQDDNAQSMPSKPAEVNQKQPTNRKDHKVVNAFNQQRPQENKAQELPQKRPYEGAGRTILVSTTQTGNPLLRSLTNTNWRYVKTSATTKIHYDYQVRGRNVIFLSLKYHKLRPEYIDKKLQPLASSGGNILLCVVDIEDSENILKELTQMSMFSGFTLLLAFSFEQAAKYLMFMNK
ncbi:HER232Wp [Eremothecium sinecaudum]|uniref:HER232Wp n=1 Tax=Eremothecium sinecaudum TaxID=45286 RepID=A0A120K2H2_9SACH|nr:HER232Wp [Eremothecium sinecaudum]AMD21510.1 HER232Wp [Eremothecium sinecaudum]